jgi:hypothetical protein
LTRLASSFKLRNPEPGGGALTEATRRTLDRLVSTRFPFSLAAFGAAAAA